MLGMDVVVVVVAGVVIVDSSAGGGVAEANPTEGGGATAADFPNLGTGGLGGGSVPVAVLLAGPPLRGEARGEAGLSLARPFGVDAVELVVVIVALDAV